MALSALGALVILGLLLCLVYYFAWEITRPLRRARYDLLVRAS
ncbi:MAG: hypothetical protein KatS3mg126_0760 [Lysobacteraceae bacterium]|nr:MAG: hypothetical protein KatS3mg126_0760 [Xanthomonadaceae bacterium]